MLKQLNLTEGEWLAAVCRSHLIDLKQMAAWLLVHGFEAHETNNENYAIFSHPTCKVGEGVEAKFILPSSWETTNASVMVGHALNTAVEVLRQFDVNCDIVAEIERIMVNVPLAAVSVARTSYAPDVAQQVMAVALKWFDAVSKRNMYPETAVQSMMVEFQNRFGVPYGVIQEAAQKEIRQSQQFA